MTKPIKGILLAGGTGSRLYPVTLGVSKQLLPIYDKPMVYYPLSILMLAGIQDILLITTPHDQSAYQRLLGDGSAFGLNISYAIQDKPAGIAQALQIGAKFIAGGRIALALGDNFFFGESFSAKLEKAINRTEGATVFAYKVRNPEAFGVIEFDSKMNAISLQEKPIFPQSDYAVTGLYFYDEQAVSIANSIKPSARGELEITSINISYLSNNQLHVELLGRGFTWLDTGTHENLLEASHLVHAIEKRQGLKIACLEEIAFNKGWLNSTQLLERAHLLQQTSYGQYLYNLAKQIN